MREKLSDYSTGVGHAGQVEAMEAQWTQREIEAAQERAEARKLAALFQQVLPRLSQDWSALSMSTSLLTSRIASHLVWCEPSG